MGQMRFLLIAFLLLTPLNIYPKDILISFDGSASLEMWKNTLDYAKENNLKFTYFVSAPYFVVEGSDLANDYWAPKVFKFQPIGFRRTNVGWAVQKRREYIDKALDTGHEIGSHLVGHYNGRKWTKEQWAQEFAFFDTVFPPRNEKLYMKGIRAPELGINQAYYDYLDSPDNKSIIYDSSAVKGRFPIPYGFGKIKQIPMQEIRIINKPTSGYILPMDFNFTLLNCTVEEKKIIFLNSMKNYYNSIEEPFMICLHFELMDNGIYYEVMKELVEWLKDKNPRYLTYTEYLQEKK